MWFRTNNVLRYGIKRVTSCDMVSYGRRLAAVVSNGQHESVRHFRIRIHDSYSHPHVSIGTDRAETLRVNTT